MSDSPDDSGPEQGGNQRGGQPQGGQPQGGQPQGGQPQGGQPQGGQPQGGQPQGGQPQGGQPGQYQQGQRQPRQTGPGIGDIFSRAETMSELKIGTLAFVAISLGIGLTVMIAALVGGQSLGAATSLPYAGMALIPLMAALLALRQAREIDDGPDKFVYANSAVTGLVGGLAFGIIVALFGTIGNSLAGGGGGFGAPAVAVPGFGPLIIPVIVIAIGAAITGAIAAWGAVNLVPGAGGGQAASQRQPQQGQQPQR